MIISIELKDVIPSGVLAAISEEAVFGIVRDVMDGARDKWIQLANENLHTTRDTYARAIQEVEYAEGTATLTLLGLLANIIEHGMPTTDLRDTLLGPNVPEAPFGQKGKRRAEAGHYYRAVPFRHQIPGSTGTQAPPMGDPYKSVLTNAGELGKKIYQEAKKLGPGQRLPAGLAPKLKPHHATDIYAGMQKDRAAYNVAIQSKYTTFRTISEAVSTGWIRPDTTPGAQLHKGVQAYIQRVAPMAFSQYVKSLGGGT